MTATELVAALRRHYPAAHGWLLLPQVRDATGARGNRTADAIAMNAWPSRGLEVHGFELKTYRGDWLRELKQPQKAESVFAFCDRWWIVTPEPVSDGSAVVRVGELPPTWGLMVVDADGRIGEAQPAPKLAPAPLDRTFVASVLRSLQGCATPEAELQKVRAEAHAAGHEEGYARALRRRSDFDAIRFQREDLERLETTAGHILKRIREELKQVRDLPRVPPDEPEDDAPPGTTGRAGVAG